MTTKQRHLLERGSVTVEAMRALMASLGHDPASWEPLEVSDATVRALARAEDACECAIVGALVTTQAVLAAPPAPCMSPPLPEPTENLEPEEELL